MTKHKRWLADLQKTKDRLEKDYLEEQQRKEETIKKFQENERKMREAAISTLKSDRKDDGYNEPQTDNDDKVKQTLDWARRESANAGFPASKSQIAPSKTSNKSHSKASAKPAWAKSAKESENKDDDEQDELDLLDFANSLDFEKVINDIEVQTMMEKLQQRILDLEKDISQDTLKGIADEKNSKREMLALIVRNNLSLQNRIKIHIL